MPTPELEIPELKEYIVRSPAMEDAEIVAELFNICSIALVGKKEYEANDFRMSWKSPNFDFKQSCRLVFSKEDQLVGFCSVSDHNEPYVRIGVACRVHPEFREDGIGEALLRWGETRARQAVDKAPDGSQVIMSFSSYQQDAYSKGLAENHGMEITRHFFQMEIEFDGPPEEPVVPEGILIRPYKEGIELEDMAAAYLDSFRDHYGFAEQRLENLVERIQFMTENDPHYTPGLWFVAVDGEDIAGLAINAPKTTEDPEMGFVNILGVRRPWRRRGLGLALLQHSFQALYQGGSKRAGLGVDASSLTGATRLYEKAGMFVKYQFDAYKKVLRDGEDLTTSSIGE